jgi:predicted transcriptional regulator
MFLKEDEKNMSKRKMYNNNLNPDLMRKIRILAAQLNLRQNDLLEEAIRNLIEKYEHQDMIESNS